MLAQRLRHRVTIQSKTYSGDSTTGEQTITWADVLTNEPAEVVPSSGKEFRASGAVQGQTLGRITIRKPPQTIDHTMRILFLGDAYQIDAVLPDPTFRRHLSILYSQGVNDGQ